MNERPPKSMSGNETTGKSNIQATPGSIFICYRRDDTADVTGRLYDRLADHFGPGRVFIDVETIRLGYDFRSEIDERIKACSIVIVVIGDEWLAQVDGKRRIDDENDRVRIEIEAALRREIPIIPVLTRGASHPTKVMLPASLEALAYRHGTSIRHEHFRGDVDFLISQMDKLLAGRESILFKPAESKEHQETDADPPSVAAPITQTTQSQLPISPVASISAIAASKEPAVWRRKPLIIVTAGGGTVLLLVTITVLLTRPHPSVPKAVQGNDDTIPTSAMELGMKYNNPIIQVQEDLRTLGFYKGQSTGTADQATVAAIIEFQKANGVVADGLLGPQTTTLIQESVASMKKEN